MSLAALHRLRWKYRVLLGLRERREEVEASGATHFPADEAAARRKTFRRLARVFPGSLRELDHADAHVLRRRLALVERGISGRLSADDATWLEGVWSTHLLLRLAASVRRWRRRQSGEEEVQGDFLVWSRLFESRIGAASDANGEQRVADGAQSSWRMDSIAHALGVRAEELLHFVCRPPGGRLRPLVEAAVQSSRGLQPSSG